MSELFWLIMLAVVFLWPDVKPDTNAPSKRSHRTAETGPGLSSYPPHS